jgi:hypothetical protein
VSKEGEGNLKIDEAVWRIGHILLIFPDKENSKLFIDKAEVKIFWGDKCLASGEARSFCNEKVISKRVMLDIYEIYGLEKFTKPDRIEILVGKQKINFPIAMSTKGEAEKGFIPFTE